MRKIEQNGSVHVVVVVTLVLVLVVALGFIFWQNFIHKEPNVTKTETVTKTQTKDNNNPYDGWKTYTSITPSMFSFKYPPDWQFTPATEEFVNNSGGKNVTHTLLSKKPELDPNAKSPVTINQYMCVTFTEYTGNWQYSNETYSGELDSETFSVEDTLITLGTYADKSLGERANKPMGNILRLVSNPGGSKGQSYIDTNNDYRVEANAQYNCIQGGEGIENLDADFDTQPDTINAKLILKSIRF